MDPVAFEALTLRVVELAVQGRSDPRLLVATASEPPRPKRTTRTLAGLANSAGDRTALLLIGVEHRAVVGVATPPPQEYWDEVRSRFPGFPADFDVVVVDVGERYVVAAFVHHAAELITATHHGRAVVPWYENGALGRARVPPAHRGEPAEGLPSSPIAGAWLERSATSEGSDLFVYRGVIELTLGARVETIADRDFAATVSFPGSSAGAVTLETQIHPSAGSSAAVVRRAGGIDIAASFRARLLLAAARREPGVDQSPETEARLVVEFTLPGQPGSPVGDVVLRVDETRPGRWLL